MTSPRSATKRTSLKTEASRTKTVAMYEPVAAETPAERWERVQRVEKYSLLAPADKQRYVQDLLLTCRGFDQETRRQQSELAEMRRRVTELEEQRGQLDQSLRAQHAVTRTYEHFGFVPPSINAETLKQQIAAIENDIREAELVTDYKQNLLMPSLADDERGRLWQLLELKFQRLELLITVLKKRILKFEENEHLGRVVKGFGDISSLLNDNQRLWRENVKLRSREQRFECEPLLDRHLERADATFLRILCMALQNELSAHRDVLDKFSVQRNPSMTLLVATPERLPDQISLADLDTWLTDETLKNDFSEELEAWRKANEHGVPPSGFADLEPAQLIQLINAKDQEKLLLKKQIDRLLEERRGIANVAVMREYCDQEFKHPLKGLAKKQFQDLNEKLSEEVKEANDRLRQAEDTIAMQIAVFEDASRAKERYMQENVLIGRRVLQLLQQNRRLKTRLERATHVGHVLYEAALSTIHAVLEEKVDEPERARLVQHLHADLLREYLRQYTMLVRLQSWFRGMRVRRQWGLHPTIQKVTAWLHKLRRAQGRRSDTNSVHSAHSSDSAGPLLPVLKTLAQVVFSAQSDINSILEVPKVLSICRREVKDGLLPRIRDDLASWKEYVDGEFEYLYSTMAEALKPKEMQDFAMQTTTAGVDVEVQTEEEHKDEHDKKVAKRSKSVRGSNPVASEKKPKSKKKSRP